MTLQIIPPYKQQLSPFLLSGHNIDPRVTPIRIKPASAGGGLLSLNDRTVNGGAQASILLGGDILFPADGSLYQNVGAGPVAIASEYFLGAVPDTVLPAYLELKWNAISGIPTIQFNSIENTWSFTDGGASIADMTNNGITAYSKQNAGTVIFTLSIRWIPSLLPNPYTADAEEVSATITLIRP